MEEAQQQQRRQHVHRGVIDGIARLDDPDYREERHKLIVDGFNETPIGRHSLQHLVNFLGEPSRDPPVTELVFYDTHLPHPSDGGLQVLQSFFARSDTTLTKVTLRDCNFGSQQDASMLLAAFERNRTVSDLSIRRIQNLEGAALGNSLSSLMQNMPQLQRLDCYGCVLRVEGVRAFQPRLRNNHTLKKLDISFCEIGDEGIRLVADALVGNTTIEILNICGNGITSVGLADVTRLLESAQLKTITFWGNPRVFNEAGVTHQFVTTLQHKNSSVQGLPGINQYLPFSIRAATYYYASINNSLKRNQQLNHVNLLLAPPPPPPPQQQQQRRRHAAAMMLKTWHKAITKFAKVPNNVGASAIFKLFTARPGLLEKRLKRPAAADATAATAISPQQASTQEEDTDKIRDGIEQKRRRL